jgi:hypothetical protein
VSALVGDRLPRAAHLSVDAVTYHMIRSGLVPINGRPAGEALRQDELCNRNMCALANNFVDFGFTVLMDTVIADRTEFDFFLALMSPRPVRLVVLAPGIDVCKARNAARPHEQRFDFDGYERLDVEMRQEFGDLGWWLDSSQLSADETAELVVAETADRTRPLQPGWHAWLRRLHDV